MASSQHVFSAVPRAEMPRSSFNRSHGHKTTFDAGWLVPIYVDEALPGDTFNLRMTAFARLATPLFPIMDNLYLDFFFFAVPNRLLWDNWQRFMGERSPTPESSIDFVIPKITAPAGGFAEEEIYDYLGLPTKIPNIRISALPLRAYNMIWNEWFRDQNLQDAQPQLRSDAGEPSSTYGLLKRGKRHDYFTSALPWTQKGDPVEIPLGTTAPLKITGDPAFRTTTQGARNLYAVGDGATVPNATFGDQTAPTFGPEAIQWYNPGLEADLSQATSATINSLRQAFQVQKMLERDARGGTRYTEILRAHFGVVSPDARLQRPEYLGGGSTPVVVNPVAQTNASPTTGANADNVKGSLAAYAVGGAHGIGFTKSFTEHCTILGLACLRADLNYQQGINRMWSRSSRYDFYWPALSHLGEQDVKNKEIYAQGTADDELAFGYQERWAEYRYKPGQITGRFRSNATGTLESWHLALDFASLPTLSATFIEEHPPVKRCIAVQTEPDILFDSHFSIKCARPMPTYSVPGYIDHF